MRRIGLVSDTHGLVRPEALAFLGGADYIVHAGDICDEKTLAAFAGLAPVTAVRGNNDIGAWARALPLFAVVAIERVRILVLHDLGDLERALRETATTAGVDVIVSGHSHRPHLETRAGVTRINPGSAGPRRFSLPIGVAELIVDAGRVAPRLVTLECAPRCARTRGGLS
jgi:putative phosphoesterase